MPTILRVDELRRMPGRALNWRGIARPTGRPTSNRADDDALAIGGFPAALTLGWIVDIEVSRTDRARMLSG